MNFREGLNYIYKNRSSDLELTDPFLLYCGLSDLCSASFEDKHKVVLFYQIDKKINVVQSILNNYFDVTSKYLEVAELISVESFNGLIDVVKKVLDVNFEEQEVIKPKSQKKVAQAVVTKTEEPQEDETTTPLVSSYYNPNNDWIVGVSVVGGIAFTLILLITFACIFNWGWPFWQWMIGVVGGGILFAILVFVVWWLNEEMFADFYVLGSVILGIFVVVNFVLLLIFGANYKIIFGCLSVFEIIGGLALIFSTFEEWEEGWGAFQIVETSVSFVVMLIGLIFL